jgi:hypothetical protein
MVANRIAFCRSLLAGDSDRPPTAQVFHRLQAGSYIPTTPKVGRSWLLLVLLWTLIGAPFASANEAVWQWSVPMGEGRAFLWVPEECQQVRAVVVAQHNMVEQGILEHTAMRRTLAALGIAEVFIAPPFDRPFQFERGAGERFDAMMRALAEDSGYGELASVPVVPMGHSACASFPWNFAAWNPGGTLAILSIKGDAPQTDLTGSGAPNPEWGARTIDGIPGLFVMSEQEWWEDRLLPLLKFRAAHPATPLAVLADTGHGHFDATDELVEFLAMFIRKAAEARLPNLDSVGGALRPDLRAENDLRGVKPLLQKIDPAQGWLAGRWRRKGPQRLAPVPAAQYRGDSGEAFWCFDEEMAWATETYHAKSDGKQAQQVDFVQAGALVPITTTHTGVNLQFLPEADGVTFGLGGAFIAPLPAAAPVAAKDQPPPSTTIVPTPAAPGTHAAGAVVLSPITGPVEQLGPDTFRVAFNRTYSTTDTRGHDIWILARHPGDARYKGTVQQALLRLPRFMAGAEQTITFPPIPDQKPGTPTVALAATSDAGVPVGYYVREGPAFVRDRVLHLTPLPPRAKLQVKVTVVAWQLGRGSEAKLRVAPPVEQSFLLQP